MDNRNQKLAIIIPVAAAAVIFSFVAGFIVFRSKPAGAGVGGVPVAVVDPPGPAEAAPISPAIPVPPPAPELPGLMAAVGQVSAAWAPLENGCTVVQDGTKFHIVGASDKDDWNHWNGVQTRDEYPEGDFTVSADFMVPKFTQPGGSTGLVYLRASSRNGDQIGIFFRPGSTGYRLQTWESPMEYSAWLPRFGDETSVFHRMKMDYVAATHVATGWIDDRKIGTVEGPMSGMLQFEMVANTSKAGMSIDLWYDKFELVVGGKKVRPEAGPAIRP